MIYRYIAYSLIVFVTSMLLINLKVLYDLKESLSAEERRIHSLKASIYSKEADLERFKKLIEEEKIEILSRNEALERLLSFVERLKKTGSVKVLGGLRDVNGVWTMEVVLEKEVRSREEVISLTKRLISTNSPIADISELKIDTEQGKLTIKVLLLQPYMEN